MERCKACLIEAAAPVRMRIPDSLNSLCLLQYLSSESVMRKGKPNIDDLLLQFPSLTPDQSQAAREYENLRFSENLPDVDLNPVRFRITVQEERDAGGKPRFQNISEFALALLTMPFSNAAVERVFSTMSEPLDEVQEERDAGSKPRFQNISEFALALFTMPFSNAAVERVFSKMSVVKTKLRNRLLCETVEGILFVRYGLAGVSLYSFTPSRNMLRNFSDKMYHDDEVKDVPDENDGDVVDALDVLRNTGLTSKIIRGKAVFFVTYFFMDSIDRLDPRSVRFVDWFCDYLLANRPCIFTSSITEQWRSRKEWVDDKDYPNTEYLIANFGDADVPVVDVRQSSGYDSNAQSKMKFRKFISDHFHSSHGGEECLYLKDWHFVNDFPTCEPYNVPVYFQNDWLNEYWDAKQDPVEIDYRFAYFGGRSTWTMFHADVFRSHSWSANISGEKLWILVRPGIEDKLRTYCKQREVGSQSMNDIRSILERHPQLEADGDVLQVVQKPGELIFVPSNWHHQVHNLGSVISINHNWCNGCNIGLIWRYLCDRLDAVKSELSDCRSLGDMQDWLEQCQIILKCDAGMDFRELLSLFKSVADTRILRLKSRKQNKARLIERSLFRCDICDSDLCACERTSRCLGQLKQRLIRHCSCNSSLSPLCIFCSEFFDVFDVRAVIHWIDMVLNYEGASMLPGLLPFWKDRLLDIDAALDTYFADEAL